MSAVTVFRTFVATSLCTALAACTMGPDFVRPQAELPSHWQGEAVAGNAIDQDAAWWAGFDDPLLGQLANQVLAANLDLQLAANRVQQSRAARGITGADDALEFIMAGASAVQVGSATFSNPRASLDVLEGIERFMEKEGISKLSEIIGAARQ